MKRLQKVWMEIEKAKEWSKWYRQRLKRKGWLGLYAVGHIETAESEVDRLSKKWGVLFNGFLQQVGR